MRFICFASKVAEQISRRAKGVHLIMTMNNETKDAVIGESEVVALNEMTGKMYCCV